MEKERRDEEQTRPEVESKKERGGAHVCVCAQSRLLIRNSRVNYVGGGGRARRGALIFAPAPCDVCVANAYEIN